MPRYSITFAGRERDRVEVDCNNVEEARNLAVQQLGGYLADHPGFADNGHWRVMVEDEMGRTVTTVIVATVSPRPVGDRDQSRSPK